jgi:hypothetical protein
MPRRIANAHRSAPVNFGWNYCRQIDREAQRRFKAGMPVRRPSYAELTGLGGGVTKDLRTHSDAVDTCRDARDACFPKTPKYRSFKKTQTSW